MNPLYKIILCDYINPLSDKKCEFVKNGALVLKKYKDGYKFVEKGLEKKILPKYASKKSIEVKDAIGQVAMPGFYDMHFHWVQDDVRLMPKDNLLDWLSNYTWPYEAKFKERKYSKEKSASFATELLACGTLGGAVYASIHPHTVDDALKNFVGDYIVGNVLMTMNSPEYLSQTKKNAISSVTKLASKYKEKYAMTPRFAITTHPDVMKESAKIARQNKSFIQTHLSETLNEIDFVKSIYKDIKGFEKVPTYTDIYKKSGVLGKKTIMGHGIYLSKEELKTLAKTQTAVAHCPTSNAPVKEKGLGSGLFDFKFTEKHGVRWALGSDIGGGPFLSMFDVMRSFVEQNEKKKVKGATYIKALYRATMSGAEIMGKEKKTGNLESGKFANFILVDAPKYQDKDKAEEVLKKIIAPMKKKRAEYDKLVNETYFLGQCVFSKND
ncbi:amidohydrolase family protein [Halobacteriovorax sp. GB3]|uniref:amidohydrolase family protein n=1 Tax=Halobacteriovorax sp. GB3 TaxID=2719615 RepID=UPI002361A4DF|nr:amidohydrolase family protein [Halobacteriovorax sp. GB3]MDD0853169.1 amidohydrolase family protein [Halobacteriovorax sp. GB3]